MEADKLALILESIKMHTLAPNDIIVVKLTNFMPLKTMEALRGFVKAQFPANKVMVLEPGMDIEIVRPTAPVA